MNQEKNQNLINQQTQDSDASAGENKAQRNWWIEIVSLMALIYLIFSLSSPIFLKEGQQPRKIETTDVVIIAIVLLFNSGLLNRLEDFGISKEGGVTAKFQQLKQEVNQQKKQIDDLQAQQLEQLQKQQKNLEEMQAFMYNFLLSEKDYEKINQLNKYFEANMKYDFHVSDRVGDELRRLRDFKVIGLKSGYSYISEVVRASQHGHKSIDLTQYFHVTELGKKFLETRETLHSSNQQAINNL